ncbi:type II toxin-antitoxin system Phd/YefM family antitoxin [Endobacter medicaginis]
MYTLKWGCVGKMAGERVGIRALRGDLTSYLRRVQAGETLLVTSNEAVVAELRPAEGSMRPARQPGALAGRIGVSTEVWDTAQDLLDALMQAP